MYPNLTDMQHVIGQQTNQIRNNPILNNLLFGLSHIPSSSNTNFEMLRNGWKTPPFVAQFPNLCLQFYFYEIDRTRFRSIFCPVEGKFNSEISRIRAATRSKNYSLLYLKKQ